MSRAGLPLQGLLGALSSTLPAPPHRPRVGELVSAPVDPSSALKWAAARSQPLATPQHLHSSLGSQRSLCLGGHPASRGLEGLRSLLTQHPPWPSVPLPPGMQSWPGFVGNEGNRLPQAEAPRGGGQRVCWAGFAFPAGVPALLTTEVRGQV